MHRNRLIAWYRLPDVEYEVKFWNKYRSSDAMDGFWLIPLISKYAHMISSIWPRPKRRIPYSDVSRVSIAKRFAFNDVNLLFQIYLGGEPQPTLRPKSRRGGSIQSLEPCQCVEDAQWKPRNDVATQVQLRQAR